MSAPVGNKHAEKWTYENTVETLKEITHYAYQDDVLFLSEALLKTGLYNDIWAYWRRKWEDNEDIMAAMAMIMQCFEVRLFNKAARKEIQAGVAMFALRIHYGWAPPKPPKETPVPAAPAPSLPAELPGLIIEPAPKERKPLIVKHFTDISHLVPVRPYCGLPTYTEPGETGFWVRSGKNEYYKMERETYP